ncbi:glycoside hydrolase family 2 [Opitutaceae bacterium EW11]|nr:glycoside hydrolase family 2 [Opitutaceae bacterium EW11]
MFPCSSIPRPEYPRPDRQRGRVEGVDWLNLNGPWQFRFDPQRKGLDEKWFEPGGPDWREQIVVPFCWESLAAWGAAEAAGNDNYYATRVFLNPLEVNRANHRIAPRHEVGWYRRTVEIPDNVHWRKRRAILTIGASDYFTDCWCNGIHLGRHEGGYLPFEFDLTEALAAGDGRRALLVIRVEDPMDNREQPVGKQWGWYTTTSGIWQTVYVEPRSPAHIERFRITTDIDNGKAHFEIACRGASDQSVVEVDITPPQAPPHQITFPVQGGVASGEAEIYPVTLWDTADPQLYRAAFRLKDEEDREVDEVLGYFGMRKISTLPTSGKEPAMLCLNNKPIYLRGALYQSYHPAGVYTATDAEVLRNDIAYARDAGFDFLRIHIKLDDPLVLFYADTLGILLMQDFPNFGEGGDTPLGRQRFEAMLRGGIERDFNHPAIIAWCIFNETWGFGGQTELMKIIGPEATAARGKKAPASSAPSVQAPDMPRTPLTKVPNQSSFQWVHAMWQLAKSMDSTRLIEDMSVVVWEHLQSYGHVDTDINSWHFYLDDYAKAKAHIEGVIARTYRGSSFNYIEGFQQGDAPLINSEYGGVGALDGDRDVSWSFKFLTNELRRHGQLSAYIYTELHDVEWEYNGFLNYDRTQKEFGYPPSIINQGDVLPINAPPIMRCEPGSSVTVEVLSSHFSRRRRENVTLHWLYSGMDVLGTEYSELARGRAAIPFRHHRVELARKLELKLPDQPMLCTLSVAAVTPDGKTVASNFIKHFVVRDGLPERDERGNALILRKPVHAWSAAAWSGPASTPEEARLTGSCFAQGTGFFEWSFEDEVVRRLSDVRRIRLLCEVSSRRLDTPQTDSHRYPTNFELQINDLPVHRGMLPDHPHDSRGSLSYLLGGRGAYGYLIRATIEGDLLRHVVEAAARDGRLRFRCVAPAEPPEGGLTVYDYHCGRYPIGPTVIVEWEQG